MRDCLPTLNITDGTTLQSVRHSDNLFGAKGMAKHRIRKGDYKYY